VSAPEVQDGVRAIHVKPADLELADWGFRAGADVGNPQTAGQPLHEATAENVDVGVWSCTEGGWSITDRPDTEVIVLVLGRARISNADGTAVELVAGDVVVLPRGWSGRWDILEPVRKVFVTAK
jgi:uncharacterized cupin superfamily protein